MSPLRRYLRITRYSVLEVRIYLDDPSEASWLLASRDAVLQRIIDAVRPKVLPKLREENENAKKKGGKKKKNKGIKDVKALLKEDFEVTIFLTELSTRHSLLTKQKQFVDKPKLRSTGDRLTNWANGGEGPIVVDDDDNENAPPEVLLEDTDEAPAWKDLPEPGLDGGIPRPNTGADGDDALFVRSSDEEGMQEQRSRPPRRSSRPREEVGGPPRLEIDPDEHEDKKKLALSTSYDGFSIYGRILCLLVKRKGRKAQAQQGVHGGSQMMEEWVSTQAAQETGLEES